MFAQIRCYAKDFATSGNSKAFFVSKLGGRCVTTGMNQNNGIIPCTD